MIDHRPHYTTPVDRIDPTELEDLARLALAEDLPAGDITSDPIFQAGSQSQANIVAREPGILAGQPAIAALLATYQKAYNPFAPIVCTFSRPDGAAFEAGQQIATLQAATRDLLRLERTILNFLQYLCGIATTAFQARALLPAGLYLLDTRKTLPGYRKLAKYAVNMGQGTNHRLNLSEMAMIKDNHILAAGSIAKAARAIRMAHPDCKLEIEIDRLEQLPEAIECLPNILLLDNMDLSAIDKALTILEEANCPAFIEISGNWTPEKASTLKELCTRRNMGISMGYITHTTRFLDLSMEMNE